MNIAAPGLAHEEQPRRASLNEARRGCDMRPDDRFDATLRRPSLAQGACVNYALLSQATRATKMSRDPNVRQDYHTFCDTYVAPALNIEEVALQWLATRVSGLYLLEGHILPLRISCNLLREPVHAYATHYRIDEVLNDMEHGCLAFQLKPLTEDLDAKAIILFGGTANETLGDVLALENYPLGYRNDLDTSGIGASGYRHNTARLTRWVETFQTQNRRVLVLGHSLGGAMATRLFSHLTPDQQANAELFTFCAPGIEASQVAQIVPGRDNVRLARHSKQNFDPVPRFGEQFPAGRLYTIYGWDGWGIEGELPHGIATWAVQLLDRQTVRFGVRDVGIQNTLGLAERARRTLGHFRGGERARV